MISKIDKAWVGAVVAFLSSDVLAHFFNINLSLDVQSAITAVITGILVWAVPNKQA